MAGQWLVVANGGLPAAAEAIIDFPLDRLPPLPDPSDPSFASRLEVVLRHSTQNERNELTRTNITLSAFSSLYSAVVLACEKNRYIYSWQQMRGREWDEPKTVEVRTLERLGAFTKLPADDASIKGRRVVETMWTGRVKRNADRSVDKRKGRAVLRGDLHKQHYAVDANQATAPVVRSSSMQAQDCVAALRQQHCISFDAPSAYLQGIQTASEQVVARAPPGFREYDERGVELYWLMHNPLYGQLDAGAIWNRTFNEFVTRQGPPATSGTSSSHAAEIEAVQA